jgi:two-component sensor histidine kinase
MFVDNYKTSNKKYRLKVSDDGVGFVQEKDLKNSKTLGMQLIDSLVNQLDGIISIQSDKGTTFQIDF